MKKNRVILFVSDDDIEFLQEYIPMTFGDLLDMAKTRKGTIGEHSCLIKGLYLSINLSSPSQLRSYKRMIRALYNTASYYYSSRFFVYDCIDRLAAEMLFKL